MGRPIVDQKIVQEIDQTLDQLIHNAEIISDVDPSKLAEMEMEAFQKTQESLLHHLWRCDQLDPRSASRRLREKRARFEQMKSQYAPQLQKQMARRSLFSKRRKKKFLDTV